MNNKKVIWALVAYLIFTSVSIMQQGCNKVMDTQEKQEPNLVTSEGSGGSAILVGTITSSEDETVSRIHLYVLRSRDYSAKLAELTVDSVPIAFRIVNLPLDTVDVIAKGSGFLTAKKAGIILGSRETRLSEAIVLAESVQDLFVPDEILVQFKAGVSQQKILEVIALANCTIKFAETWPIGTPGAFLLDIPDDKSVEEMVDFFNALPETEYAVPHRVVRIHG